MNKELKEQRMLTIARDHFSECGYYGARMDTIASKSKINKRIVYEFCHKKETLYMMVLSDVSREAQKAVDNWFSTLTTDAPANLYRDLIHILEMQPAFIRIWGWEELSQTIHGPRILETVNSFFQRLRQTIRATHPHVTDETFDAIEALCHGYMLASGIYLQTPPDLDETDIDINAKPVYARPEAAIKCQNIFIETLQKLLASP